MNISKNLLKNAAVLLMGAGAVCSATTSANATNARNWNGYTWARSGNLSIQLVNNTSAKWTPYLETAASQWSAAANIDYRVVTGPTVDASVCSPSYGVIEVCSANYGKTGWIGMTNVYTSGGHVVRRRSGGTIFIRTPAPGTRAMPGTSTPAATSVAMRSV